MLEKTIRLNELNDVTEFVKAAEQCRYDVDVFYNRIVIDAKSILGVLSMDLTKPLTVKYAAEDRGLERTLEKFAL